jgi:RNA polymerase sigma-70 factor (ECF subfamily)
MEDKEIVELYWRRDERAIAESAAKYGAYCRSVAGRILRNDEDTEECVSDTWLHAWNAMPTDRPERLSLYLGRLSRWLSLNRLRDRERLRRGGGEVTLALEELDELIPAASDTEKAVEQRELSRCIKNYVNQMKEPERSVFLCRYWYLAPIGEIASRFGFGESKVKSMLLRSRRKLKAELEKEGYL